MPLTIGTQLGSHEITALLGKGGMGEVYRARDLKLKREVAIKILPEEFSRDADRVIRFQREAEALASLNHPNIAAIYDLQESGNSRFFVLELVEGETLADRIANGAIPVEETLKIAMGICEALEAAHEKGIVHRDLKPANIKITPEGRVKVLDFGLAKMFGPPDASRDPSNSPTLMSGATGGVILGTASYMSPEQARGQNVDAQSDVWAFGCVVYEMLTGQLAFTGETITDILGAIVRIDPDWNALPPDTPPLMRLLVRQCLQKLRAARLRHIGDAGIQLAAISTDIATVTSPVVPQAEVKKRRPSGWMIATVVLAAIIVGIGPFAIRSRRNITEPLAVRFTIPAPNKALFPAAIASPFPAISHDGHTVLFLAISDGVQRVWIRPLNSSEARPLAGTEGVTSESFSFWSADDRFIGFFVQGRLKKISIDGGPAQVICDAPGGTAGTWNRDGVILFSDNGVLKRVSASGGKSEALTTLDASRHETAQIKPEFLPDGNHFLFLSRTSSLNGYAIMAGTLDSKNVKVVLNASSFAQYDSGYLLFVRNFVLMAQPFDTATLQVHGDPFTVAEQVEQNPNTGVSAFSVSGNGMLTYHSVADVQKRKLQWFDRSGRSLGSVGPTGAYRNPELSPDGKRIAVELTDPQTQSDNLWLIDVSRGVLNRFTFGPSLDMYPLWSPTGGQIAFGSSRSGVDSLYVKPSEGGAEELLLKGAAIPRDWSRDNRFLVYGVAAATQLMVLPLSGDRKPFAFLPNSAFNTAQSRISPDGKWLAYYSNESGSNEIYVQNFPVPSAKYQISTNGGISPRWRHDGKEISYVSLENKLVAVPVHMTEKGIEVSPSTVLFDVGNGAVGKGYGTRQQYDVTADGQRFLVNTLADPTIQDPLTVVLNWPVAVKR
jgi:Tol biopolymer transport system component